MSLSWALPWKYNSYLLAQTLRPSLPSLSAEGALLALLAAAGASAGSLPLQLPMASSCCSFSKVYKSSSG
jgi:hypothetical protein